MRTHAYSRLRPASSLSNIAWRVHDLSSSALSFFFAANELSAEINFPFFLSLSLFLLPPPRTWNPRDSHCGQKKTHEGVRRHEKKNKKRGEGDWQIASWRNTRAEWNSRSNRGNDGCIFPPSAMIYENGRVDAARRVSLLLLRANHLQTAFIRGSALIEWTERKVMTFRWRLSVTWNKVVKTCVAGIHRSSGVSSPTVSFRLRSSDRQRPAARHLGIGVRAEEWAGGRRRRGSEKGEIFFRQSLSRIYRGRNYSHHLYFRLPWRISFVGRRTSTPRDGSLTNWYLISSGSLIVVLLIVG